MSAAAAAVLGDGAAGGNATGSGDAAADATDAAAAAAAATAAAEPKLANGGTSFASRPPADMERAESSRLAAALQEVLAAGRRSLVRLRFEYVSSWEAAALGWGVLGLTCALLAAVIALSIAKFSHEAEPVLFEGDGAWYIVHVSVAGATLAALLTIGLRFGVALVRVAQQHCVWKRRRWLLARGALVMLCTQALSVACWLASNAYVLARQCAWFDHALAWLGLLRWTCLNIQFVSLLVLVHGACRYRGPAADVPDPNLQLVMDAPAAKRARLHAPKLLLWLVFEGCIIAKTLKWMQTKNDGVAEAAGAACKQYDYDCTPSGWQVATAVLVFLLTATVAVWYMALLRRASRDHRLLPYSHYRLSSIYVRIMAIHAPLMLSVVLASLLLLELSHIASCWSYVDRSLGTLPVQVSLSLLVGVQAMLLSPKNPGTHDVLQAWYQQIAWTEEDLSAAISRRELRVRRARWALAHNRFPGALEGRLRALSALRRSALKRVHSIGHAANQQLRHVQEVAAAALAGLGSQHGTSGSASSGAIPTPAAGAEVAQVAEVAARAPGGASAGSGAEATHGGKQQQQQVEQCVERWAGHGAALGEAAEPMFCFERAVRLFAWSQLAYRYWWGGDMGGCSQETAMGLFDLQHFEAFHDPVTDTRALLAWRDGCLVLAFRGTASTQNAITDAKAWSVPLEPRRTLHGQTLKVHKGFYESFRTATIRGPVKDRLLALAGSAAGGPPLKVFLTGHSLGGSLAALAAFHVKELLGATADVSLYSFGAPRVGNAAFTRALRRGVPDCWSVINDQDPVPRVPAGLRCAGLRVLLNGRGDILARPSYFERRIMSRSGGVPSHHRLPRYALALASVVKAQFLSAQALYEGEAGATALVACMDVGAVLLLRNMDLPSLRDPAAQPELRPTTGPASLPGIQQTGRRRRRGGGCGGCGGAEDGSSSSGMMGSFASLAGWCGAGGRGAASSARAAATGTLLEEVEEGRAAPERAQAAAAATAGEEAGDALACAAAAEAASLFGGGDCDDGPEDGPAAAL